MAKYTLHESIVTARVLAAAERNQTTLDDVGFCLACGAEAHGVEPDARRYPCESCGMRAVFGAEEILMMGFHWSSRQKALEAKARRAALENAKGV